MHRFYNMILKLSLPFVWARLYVKGWKVPAYRQRINERFARGHNLQKVDIWLHAVSLGEVIAATPLIRALLKQNYQLMVTTTTPTGSKKLLEVFGGEIQHQYLPYDLPSFQKRFLKQIRPQLILLMETEIWPNLITESHKQGVPIAIINARLSERSLKGYGKISRLIAPALQKVHSILAQTHADAERFRQLAGHASKPLIETVGNMKFDHPLPENQVDDEIALIKTRWGSERPVLILASTHDNEEQKILAKFAELKAAVPGLLILIAPRHPERFEVVLRQTKQMGFVTYQRSQADKIQADAEVIILDCLGELMRWYSVADVAFVGGSLVPIGGHNVLEPAMASVATVTGPNMFHFQLISKLLTAEEGLIVAKNQEAVIKGIIDLLTDADYRQSVVEAAHRVLAANRGALTRYCAWINAELNHHLSQIAEEA